MDLLVTLCATYRLNPSSHTLELVTANKKSTKLKPNALIGSLEAEKIILKAKGDEKNKKTGPQMPEVQQSDVDSAVSAKKLSHVFSSKAELSTRSCRQPSGW